MWCDELPPAASWASLWHGYIACGACPGIRRANAPCPACGDPAFDLSERVVMIGEREVRVAPAFMGAEARYEDWMYLNILQREWERPIKEGDDRVRATDGRLASPRAAIVVLFWSYFETRIDRLLRTSLRSVPERLRDDILKRYSGIGARLERLYDILFATTYHHDLRSAGYSDVAFHLSMVHKQRNAFAHGEPQAIDDSLVSAVVAHLKREHEAWITIFNQRGGRPLP